MMNVVSLCRSSDWIIGTARFLLVTAGSPLQLSTISNLCGAMTSTTIAATASKTTTTIVACSEQMDEDSNKRPLLQIEEYDHLDKRPRWTTTTMTMTTMSRSLSMDSNVSTRTEASASSSVASQGGNTMHISAHQIDDNLEAVILEDLVDQMETWSVTNLKEWRQQQTIRNNDNNNNDNNNNNNINGTNDGISRQKEKFRMAKREMLQALRRSNTERIITTTTTTTNASR